MDYTALIRQAHLNSLRQKYLDLIEDARLEKEQKQLEYNDNTQNAYVENMKGMRDKPQQLRATGISGGLEETELIDVKLEYENQLEKLKKEREQFIANYNRIVEVQTRAMNNAVEEYNSRVALEDYNSAQKAAPKGRSKAKSKSSGGSSKSKNERVGPPYFPGGKVDVMDLLPKNMPVGPYIFDDTLASMK